MFIARQNPNGGKPITRFSLSFDTESYSWGHQIGFCPNCHEPQLLRTKDAADLARVFGEDIPLEVNAVVDVFKKQKTSLIRKLFG